MPPRSKSRCCDWTRPIGDASGARGTSGTFYDRLEHRHPAHRGRRPPRRTHRHVSRAERPAGLGGSARRSRARALRAGTSATGAARPAAARQGRPGHLPRAAPRARRSDPDPHGARHRFRSCHRARIRRRRLRHEARRSHGAAGARARAAAPRRARRGGRRAARRTCNSAHCASARLRARCGCRAGPCRSPPRSSSC